MVDKPAQTGRAVPKYKIHWHVLLTHFPVSFFILSAGFMIQHFVTENACYEIASFLSMLAGAVFLVPAAISGWLTWKSRYKGIRLKMFRIKIRIALTMITLSFALAVSPLLAAPPYHTVWMWGYAAGILLLVIGAITEGFYGGRLNHR